MKHEFTDEQIFESNKIAARTTGRDWISRFNLRDVRAFLDALPEPDPQDDWQECWFNDFHPTDKRVKAVFIGGSIIEGTPDRRNSEHVFLVDGPVIHSYDDATFYRIPEPVQHPDPEVNRVVFVHATAQQRYDSLQEYPSPVFHFHWSDNKWRGDISTVLDTEDILEWEPAKVVADNDC